MAGYTHTPLRSRSVPTIVVVVVSTAPTVCPVLFGRIFCAQEYVNWKNSDKSHTTATATPRWTHGVNKKDACREDRQVVTNISFIHIFISRVL